MALQENGEISLSQIAVEFEDTAPYSLSEFYGTADGIPASGLISFQMFYGASTEQISIGPYFHNVAMFYGGYTSVVVDAYTTTYTYYDELIRCSSDGTSLVNYGTIVALGTGKARGKASASTANGLMMITDGEGHVDAYSYISVNDAGAHVGSQHLLVDPYSAYNGGATAGLGDRFMLKDTNETTPYYRCFTMKSDFSIPTTVTRVGITRIGASGAGIQHTALFNGGTLSHGGDLTNILTRVGNDCSLLSENNSIGTPQSERASAGAGMSAHFASGQLYDDSSGTNVNVTAKRDIFDIDGALISNTDIIIPHTLYYRPKAGQGGGTSNTCLAYYGGGSADNAQHHNKAWGTTADGTALNLVLTLGTGKQYHVGASAGTAS